MNRSPDTDAPELVCVLVVYPNGERVFEPLRDIIRYGVPLGCYVSSDMHPPRADNAL